MLFVVAADEGWSAQSAEHLDVLNALQVKHGVLAITRSDLGDAELAEMEARDYLAGTSLANMPAVAVSPVTGMGLDKLRTAIEQMAGALPERVDGRTRLWIDRVFTIRGAGTVVTGTLSSGEIRVGDTLQAHPTASLVRVRAIESLKQQVDQVTGVARVALNLRGAKQITLRRGDALTPPGEWLDVTEMDVLLPAGRLPSQLTLHFGSAAVPVRLRSLRRGYRSADPFRPLPLHIGERGVLRDPGARRVAAAAIVLDPLPPALGRRGGARIRAAELAGLSGQADLLGEIRRRGAVLRHDLVRAGVVVPARPATGTHCRRG